MLGVAALATVLVIAVVVVALGGSSTSKTASAGTATSRTAFVQCLKEHGVTPPAHTPGSGTSATNSGQPPAGFAAGGGSSAGSSSREAALEACGSTGQHSKPAPSSSGY
jgi:hypothetical protein